MGTVDTMMVSNVGSAAISAVSLVDSINILVIQALSALAAGGAILCSQYIGSENGMEQSVRHNRCFCYDSFVRRIIRGLSDFPCSAAARDFGAVEADVMKIHRCISCLRCCHSRLSVFTMRAHRFCGRRTTAAVRW